MRILESIRGDDPDFFGIPLAFEQAVHHCRPGVDHALERVRPLLERQVPIIDRIGEGVLYTLRLVMRRRLGFAHRVVSLLVHDETIGHRPASIEREKFWMVG